MKNRRIFAALLCAALLLGAAGCGLRPATGSQSDRAAGSAAGSAETGSAEGERTPTGSAEGEPAPDGGEQPSHAAHPIPQGDKYMAITFDDGPTGNEGGRTERLLDGLKARGVHATFFLCGYRIKDFHSMAARYRAEGHELGNHTMDHVRLDCTNDGGLRQVGDNSALIASHTGEQPTVMRPTGGAYNDAVRASMKQLGLPVILWNLDTLDWKYRDAANVRARIVEHAQDGAIVLSHDLYETTVEGVLAAIDDLQAQGYAFVTVSELAQLKGVTLEPGEVYTDFTDATLHPEPEPEAAPETQPETEAETA